MVNTLQVLPYCSPVSYSLGPQSSKKLEMAMYINYKHSSEYANELQIKVL